MFCLKNQVKHLLFLIIIIAQRLILPIGKYSHGNGIDDDNGFKEQQIGNQACLIESGDDINEGVKHNGK